MHIAAAQYFQFGSGAGIGAAIVTRTSQLREDYALRPYITSNNSRDADDDAIMLSVIHHLVFCGQEIQNIKTIRE